MTSTQPREVVGFSSMYLKKITQHRFHQFKDTKTARLVLFEAKIMKIIEKVGLPI